MPAQISATTSASFAAVQKSSATVSASSSRTPRPAADAARLNSARARLTSAQGVVRQDQNSLAKGKQKAKMLAQVDKLVQGMESLAERMSSKQLNKTQRSIMAMRFNDLQRQVNKLDGIVVSEGWGEHSQEGVTRAMVANHKKMSLSVDNRQKAEAALPEMRTFRDQIQKERTKVADQEKAARRDIDRELTRFESAEREAVRGDTVQKTREAIKVQGASVVGDQSGRETVVNLLA